MLFTSSKVPELVFLIWNLNADEVLALTLSYCTTFDPDTFAVTFEQVP